MSVVTDAVAIVDFSGNSASDSFSFRDKIMVQPGKDGTKGFKITVPIKYISNFQINFEILLINWQFNLTVTWPANCFI